MLVGGNRMLVLQMCLLNAWFNTLNSRIKINNFQNNITYYCMYTLDLIVCTMYIIAYTRDLIVCSMYIIVYTHNSPVGLHVCSMYNIAYTRGSIVCSMLIIS